MDPHDDAPLESVLYCSDIIIPTNHYRGLPLGCVSASDCLPSIEALVDLRRNATIECRESAAGRVDGGWVDTSQQLHQGTCYYYYYYYSDAMVAADQETVDDAYKGETLQHI